MPARVIDFDGTAFVTSRPPNGGVGVPGAYELAIDDVLGPYALGQFREEGGLLNRAPLEVVQALLPESPIGLAEARTAELVKFKVSLLKKQIGAVDGNGLWPPPCPGFLDWWRRQMDGPEDERSPIGVVSSGHDVIIEAVFRLYSLRLPDVIVSDDTMQRQTHLKPEQRMKPSPVPLELAIRRLEAKFGPKRVGNRQEIVYFGDDAGKDGEMAKRSEVRFGHFCPAGSPAVWVNGFRFADWDHTSELELQVM